MKLLTGKRIGQSGGELSAAVLFSFIIHIIFFSAALLLAFKGSPLRTVAPPSYRVKLVDIPPDIANLPPTMAEPAAPPVPPPPVEKPQVKQPIKAPAKASARPAGKPSPPAAVSKDAMPELDQKKAEKKTADEDARPSESAGKKQESVAVASTTGEFRFPFYLAIVRDKVERNWNPPPGAKGSKVKVKFKVLRSGRVGEVNIQESSGNTYFDMAAQRAIDNSSPFPRLPEGFFKEYEVFSVDLMEKE
ncbi:MAG: cell envelope integrity protein TolA [Nitrospirota bacterium]